MTSPSRPLLIFDGDCGFCRRWIARWQLATGDAVDYAPSQEIAPRFPEIPPERFKGAVVLVEPDGRVTTGAEAALRTLAHAPGHAWALWLYQHLPGFAPVTEFLYRIVARNRPPLSRLTGWIWGPHLLPPGETFTVWLYLRLLAVVYAIAFASLGVQVLGLIGSHGIMPAHDFLGALGKNYSPIRFWYVPSVFWLNASDAALVGACVAGVALSVLLLIGIAPVMMLASLWALYLSLVAVGQDFLSFQWDVLLLEAGVLALFLAPWRWRSRPSNDSPPSRLALWLTRWLLFRLMLSSAAAKWLSGDPTWRDLTALTYHYETQCLPPWTAWYAHHLPLAFQKFSCAAMFAIEGIVPFLFFAPRRIRFVAAGITIGFQILIMATGNYTFFNWLAIALCVTLFDDGAFQRVREPVPAEARRRRWPGLLLRPAAVVLVLLSLVPLFGVLRWPMTLLGPVATVYRAVSPLRSVNRYGLFAVMTTRRPEIILEGSNDGTTWREYAFRWKPGDVARRPAFVAPHQPRLDWQMWFAALSDFQHEPWFLYFCRRVLQGESAVLGLMAHNPFPDAPPTFLRAVVYEYHFSDAETRRASGAWWTREPRGLYCPVLTLAGDHLIAAPPEAFPPE